MSVVTGFVLICSVGEDLERAEAPPGNLARINEWLCHRGFSALVDLAEGHAVGNKHPQLFLYSAGYNDFPEDEFIAFFHTLMWETPERCVLVLQPEEGETRVVRPEPAAQHVEPR
ncbi:MAG: hypothetical protein ACREF9_20370 [Opitutaceae bacterium]